jgi:FdhD protein
VSEAPFPVVRIGRDGDVERRTRPLAVEAPVAVEVNGIGYAVMMAAPAALEDFALGFLLTERLIDAAAELHDLDVAETPAGLVVRATVAPERAARIADRVRHRTSDTACGLCGIAGLEQVQRPAPSAPPPPLLTPDAVFAGLDALREHQPLNRATGAVHAAAWADPEGRVLLAREDVGRHNALDKAIGAGLSVGIGPSRAFLLVSSRISFEMVDKALVAGTGLLAGISAPTSFAVEHARRHGLTLIALARADSFLVAHDPHGRFAQP